MRRRKILFKSVKYLFRIAALFALLAIAAVGALIVAFNRIVSQEGLKAIVLTQLQEVFHRPVQIEDVNILLHKGIRVRGLRVLDSPHFGGKELLSSDVLLARYKLGALLRRRLELDTVRLVAPRIQVVRTTDGRWNIEDLFSSTAAARSAAPIGWMSFTSTLGADLISIENGSIVYEDFARSRFHAVKNLDLKLRNFDVDEPFPYSASFENTSQLRGRDVKMRLEGEGEASLAGFDWEYAYANIDKLKFDAGNKSISASGSIRDFRSPAAELKLRAPEIDSEYLKLFAGVPDGIELPKSQWRLRISAPTEGLIRLDSLEVAMEPLKFRASGTLSSGAHGPSFKLNCSIPSIPLSRASAFWRGWAKHAVSGGASGSFTIGGNLADENKPFFIEKASFAFQDFGGVFFKEQRFTGLTGTLTAADKLDTVNLSVRAGKWSLYGTQFSNLDIALAIAKGDLDVPKLNFVWSGSAVRSRVRVKDLDAPKEVLIDGSIDKLRIEDAIAVITQGSENPNRAPDPVAAPKPRRPWSRVFKYSIPKSFPATAGKIRVGEVTHANFTSFNLETSWNLKNISTGLNQVTGNIQVGFGPGRVTDIPALQGTHKILRVVFIPFVYMHRLNNMSVISAATAYPKTLDFTRIYGEYGLKQGVVDVRLFHVDSPQLLAYGDGTVDFPREKINLHLLTRLTNSRGPLPEFLSDRKGRPSIGFFVEDDLNLPKLRVEYKKMEEDAIERSLAEALKRSQKAYAPF